MKRAKLNRLWASNLLIVTLLIFSACSDTARSVSPSTGKQYRDMQSNQTVRTKAKEAPPATKKTANAVKKTETDAKATAEREAVEKVTKKTEHYKNEDKIKPASEIVEEEIEIKEPVNSESYDGLVENEFLSAKETPLSTFSIDVDAASYSNVRRFLERGMKPNPDAIRIEEMINYFQYDYPQPSDEHPFAIHTELGESPWNKGSHLLHIGLQGEKMAFEDMPPSNLVFLIDVSGSMNDSKKLGLIKESLELLIKEMRPTDRVALVTYAGNAGLVLPSTPFSEKRKISRALRNLKSGGGTAGGRGIELAYKVAKDNFSEKGNNRVILCTDGDFNVGPSSKTELVKLIEEKRKENVFLTVLGFGTGNYHDAEMEALSNAGNGNYGYIDNIKEAEKMLIDEMGGTLHAIAKDVKLQIEFNPAIVESYRLIGYENRLLNKEDFNDDTKDAGELGAGHTVTAIYEITPVGANSTTASTVDPLKYQTNTVNKAALESGEWVNIKFRYKPPTKDKSILLSKTVTGQDLNNTTNNYRFSAAVAYFGMLLRESKFTNKQFNYKETIQLAKAGKGKDAKGYRADCIKLMEKAKSLSN